MLTILTQQIYRQTLASITATILPNHRADTLFKMVKAGVTIFRVNLSWFDKRDKRKWKTVLMAINEIAQREKLVLGVMLDTKGPEFRVGRLKRGVSSVESIGGREIHCIDYRPNKEIVITLNPAASCDENKIAVAVSVPQDTRFNSFGKWVMLGDGKYRAEILPDAAPGNSVTIKPSGNLRVWRGSKINFPGTYLSAPSITREESEALKFFVDDLGSSFDPPMNFMFAQSFVKTATDIEQFKGSLAAECNILNPIIIAKMETYESFQDQNLESIVEAASAVMIARGDLANETSRGEVPRFQRKIIQASKKLGKPVLLATEIYHSMAQPGTFHCSRPEAEDVRSALEQAVDGFVLTGETTSRSDPDIVVQELARQIRNDEEELIRVGYFAPLRQALQKKFHEEMRGRVTDPVVSAKDRRMIGTIDFAIAAVFRANFYEAVGIFPFTAEGGTVRAMSRFYPETPIYALTNEPKTAQLLLLHRCTHPILINIHPRMLRRFGVNDLKTLVREVVDIIGLRGRATSNYAIGTMAHPPFMPGGADILLRIRLVP
jgi:pyruvate kinase